MNICFAIITASLGNLLAFSDGIHQEPTKENTTPVTNTEEPKTTITDVVSPRIMIEIQGAIVRPGAYAFPPDTRIYEAIERAGGLLEHAEIRDINIASRLIDGSVLSIPNVYNHNNRIQATAAQLNPPAYTRSAAPTRPTPSVDRGTNSGGEAAPACININTASQKELETLPGVGEKTAQKIMQYRDLQPFQQIEDLLNVQGIGEKRLATWRPQLCL